jgi:hypothetical protein
MESAKLVTAGWLAKRWRMTAWIWRLVLVALIAGLAVIKATGVYAQLVAAHVGERGATTSAIETQDAALAARIEVAVHNVADLDRRLNQVDTTIEEAAKRGKTNAALSAIEGQRKARAGLVDERRRDSWQPCRRNAPVWPPRAGKSRLRRRRSGTWPSSSAPTPIVRRRSGG